MRAKANHIVIYTIEASTIKKIVVVDLFFGTGIYYAAKIISASVMIGMISSIAGTEGVKRFQKRKNRERILVK
ncbi:hypothetical protein [Priestia endophytica]|uniref:hypothetical protein n=1 Tax=Priestia endophytica TaxID=135735 RepID=UPI002281B8FA|nr:hypothetical protein [Priestia endophytica]MCY8232558.1 hypothetical protein [Priestia endophytica]